MFSSNRMLVNLCSDIQIGTPSKRDLTSPLSAALYVENRELIRKAVHTLVEAFTRPSTRLLDRNGKIETMDGVVLSGIQKLTEVFGLQDGLSKDRSLSFSFKDLYGASQRTGTDQECRELRVFASVLQDGYILCEYINYLRSKRVTNPVKPDHCMVSLVQAQDACAYNLEEFTMNCITFGVSTDDLFDPTDFAVADNHSLGRIASTIITVSEYKKSNRRRSSIEVDSSRETFAPVLWQESLHHQMSRLHLASQPRPRSLNDTKPAMAGKLPPVACIPPRPLQTVITLFSIILRNKQMYRCWLEFSEQLAQMSLDALQQIIASGTLPREDRAMFVTALLRLSRKSSLYPSCLVLKGVEREPFPCASGTFGDVYRGMFQGRSVCIKVVRIYKQSEINRALKAFSREAVLWSQTRHPNILPFYGVYQLDETYRRVCLVSPWMANGNIREYLLAHPQVNRLMLARDVIRGLKYLHGKNIVHGDLKGPNILVTSRCQACLADFGLSSLSDPNILQWTSESSSQSGGTVRWKAPELIDPDLDNVATKESDMYAFGCVCYEIFTSRVPFHEVTRDYGVILTIMQGKRPSKPPDSSESILHWGLTKTIWILMEDCWDPHPENRPTAMIASRKLPGPPRKKAVTGGREATISIDDRVIHDEDTDVPDELVSLLTKICATYPLVRIAALFT